MAHVARLIRGAVASLIGSLVVAAGPAAAAWPECVDDSEIAGTWTVAVNTYAVQGCTGSGHPASSYGNERTCAINHLQSLTSGAVSHEVTSEPCAQMTGSECTRYTVNLRYRNAAGTIVSTTSFRLDRTQATPAVCPSDPPIPCDKLANVRTLGSANDQPDNFVPGETICVKNGRVDGESRPMSGNGCAAFQTAEQPYKRLGPTGQRDWLVRYQFTGLECDDEPVQNETDIPPDCETDITGSVGSCPEDTSEKCHTANGLTWCEGIDNKKNCGFANDKYTCLDSLQPDKCMAMPDGSRLCTQNAPTPPVPDNGTPGVKASPDSNMQTCTGAGACTQYNFYNSTTSTNSSRDPGQGSNSDGSGAVGPGGVPGGTGTGEGEGEDEGEVGGGGDCATPPTCTGDPIACAQLQQQWKTRCSEVDEADIVAAFGLTNEEAEGDLSNGSEGFTIGSLNSDGGFSASCPTGTSITVKGYSIDFDIWEYACQMALLFAPVTMLLGYIGAARIIYKGLFK